MSETIPLKSRGLGGVEAGATPSTQLGRKSRTRTQRNTTEPRNTRIPLPIKLGTYKTVKARFWPWLSDKGPALRSGGDTNKFREPPRTNSAKHQHNSPRPTVICYGGRAHAKTQDHAEIGV